MKKAQFTSSVSSLVLIIAGLFLIFWPGATFNIAATILGIGALVYGAVSIISSIKASGTDKSENLIEGIIAAIAGLLILMNKDTLHKLLPTLFGLFLIVSGGIELYKAIRLKQSGFTNWASAAAMAALTIVGGIVCIALASAITDTFIIGFGIFLVYTGATSFWIRSRS